MSDLNIMRSECGSFTLNALRDTPRECILLSLTPVMSFGLIIELSEYLPAL
jgi:hypothetical protein